jgi:hypothetical protein
MAYYIQIQVTLLLLFSNSLVLAQLNDNKTIPYLNERSVVSSRPCFALNSPDSGAIWTRGPAKCSSINTFSIYCLNRNVHRTGGPMEQYLEDLHCPSQEDICVNIMSPDPWFPRTNLRIPDIICIPTAKITQFRNDGTASGAACSVPIAGEIGIKTTWEAIFIQQIGYTSGDAIKNDLWENHAITVSEAAVQSNLIGDQPSNSWTSIKIVQDIMDLQWSYTFQHIGEQIRVCFSSGIAGVVFVTILSGALV